MCGIAAIVSSRADAAEGAIERMTRRLTHRGPDAQEWRSLPGCWLGHTRLSIIDLAGGGQPMADEGGRYWIVFNGEIYNYRELRERLEKRGRRFRTKSDTEVLLQAYLEFGEKAVEHLNGQFAFAIWDSAERRLFAARDRLGEKPLYWARTDQGELLMASEIKGLLASGLIRPRLSREAADFYLALWYVPPDRAIYEGIFPLSPGHAMTWREGEARQWRYWSPVFSESEAGERQLPEVIEEVRSLVKRAVRRQMTADVPVGAFLSGGLDSSTIVALMAGEAKQPIRSFSVGFGDLINELPYARMVAEAYRTEHHELQMDIGVEGMLEEMAEVYDEPFGDSSNIPTYLISRFARQHVKVVLAGDGADEIFGGYDWYGPLLRDGEVRAGAGANGLLNLRSFVLRALRKAGAPVEGAMARAAAAAGSSNLKRNYPDFWDRHLARVSALMVDRSFLWGGRQREDAADRLREAFGPGAGLAGMDRAVDFDVRAYLPGDILVKVDRAAMAHGLETRAPFLDADLVEFVLNLRPEIRFKNGTPKYLLRESCGDLWPEGLRTRAKQGFGAPIRDWLERAPVRAMMERVCRPGSPLRELLPGAGRMPGHGHAQLKWTVLCLGLWLEKRSECLDHLS